MKYSRTLGKASFLYLVRRLLKEFGSFMQDFGVFHIDDRALNLSSASGSPNMYIEAKMEPEYWKEVAVNNAVAEMFLALRVE